MEESDYCGGEKMLSLKEIKGYAYQKKMKGTYSHVMKHLCLPFVKIFLFLHLTANQITILGIIFSYVAAGLLAFGNLYYAIAAILFLYLGEITDYSDGTMARIRNSVTRLQSDLLCHFYHQGGYALLYFGLGLGLFRITGNVLYIVFGCFGTIGHLTSSYLFETKEALLREHHHKSVEGKINVQMGNVGAESKLKQRILKLFVFPVKYVRSILLLFLLIGKLDWLVIFYGLFLPFRALIFFTSTFLFFKAEEKTLGKMPK
jgi:hypothetical protein